MVSFREKMKGHNSALTLIDFARTNGDLLKAGWSAIERSLAVTPPDRTENFRSPSFTSRPSPWLSLDSSIGRNWLALIRNGRLTKTTASSPRMIPPQIGLDQRRILFSIGFGSGSKEIFFTMSSSLS